MKNSNKKLAIGMIAVASTLTACGGGSGGSGGGTTQVDTSVRYWHISYNPTQTDDKLDIAYNTIKDGKIFNSATYNLPLASYIVTENKVYKPTDLTNRVIYVNSLTDWTVNIIGDIKSDIKYEEVDLAGKNMFDTILSGYRTEGFDPDLIQKNGQVFLNQYGNKTFSAGSTCFRLVSQKNHQDSFSFTVSDSTQLKKQDGSLYPFDEFNVNNQNIINGLNSSSTSVLYRYQSGKWNDIDWSTIYDTQLGVPYSNATAVQFENKTYPANFASSIEYKTANAISEYETLLKNSSGLDTKQVRNLKLTLASLQNGCDMYNEKAAKEIYKENLPNLEWDKHE